jgi:hypothetical protein
MFDRAVTEGFLKPENRALVVSGRGPAELVESLRKARLPPAGKRREIPV